MVIEEDGQKKIQLPVIIIKPDGQKEVFVPGRGLEESTEGPEITHGVPHQPRHRSAMTKVSPKIARRTSI